MQMSLTFLYLINGLYFFLSGRMMTRAIVIQIRQKKHLIIYQQRNLRKPIKRLQKTCN